MKACEVNKFLEEGFVCEPIVFEAEGVTGFLLINIYVCSSILVYLYLLKYILSIIC